MEISKRLVFNTVRALEKESRRRWQVDVVLIPQVHHAQRRDMPQATTAMGNNGSANWANQGSDYPAVLTESDPPLGSNIKEQGISFAAVEGPTREELSKEQSFWPSGPTGEAVASFDTSGLFSGFEGATSENTGSSTFEIKEGPIQGLGFWNHITGWLAAIMGLFGAPFNVFNEEAINSGAQTRGTRTHIPDTLTTLARALVMAVMLHYVWLTLGSFPYNRVSSTNTNGQPKTFGGSTDAEDGFSRQYQLQKRGTVAAIA